MRAGAIRSLVVAGAMGSMTLGGLAAGGPASASTNDPSCFVAAINAARNANGESGLATNGALALIAQTWSGTMAAAGQISHNLNLPNLAPSNWINLGENVGVGPSCDSLSQAFMNSPEHKANILSVKFSSVGVGVVITADGTVYVTEDFMGTGSTAPAPAPQPAPAPVAPPAPAPVHTTAPAPVHTAVPVHTTVPVPVHTTAPAPKPAPAPAHTTPPVPTPAGPPAAAAIPAPSPSASPTPDQVVPSAEPIVVPDPAPAASPNPAKHGAQATRLSSHAKHAHHHKGGLLHALGSLLAHLF